MYNVVWIEKNGKVTASQIPYEDKVRRLIGILKDKGIKKIAVDGKEVK